MSKSKIEWTEEVWNPTVGCTKQSEGCANCYAIRMAWRHQHNPKLKDKYLGTVKKQGKTVNWTGQINMLEDALLLPLKRKKPTRWFVNSMSDLFHPNVTDAFIDNVFEVMKRTPRHTYQILTKQPLRMYSYLKSCYPTPLKNVWLGVSVENQKAAEERIPLLLQTPAAVRWLSMEPLLGPVNLMDIPFHGFFMNVLSGSWEAPVTNFAGKIDWVVVGGESGSKARPMHINWVRSIKIHCAAAKVPFFFKQWGTYRPSDDCNPNLLIKASKKVNGAMLDGKEYKDFPHIPLPY